ncbi:MULTISPECIES: hypothetical protein [Microbacterium]|uniref:hypothetical protein n=1 Tax=Microbacterium TaxID=33882 RepID=UPI002788427C|nr:MULTISPECIES: hypothetical protein [Microbacterium]MDQ1076815.1 hypothetical protein [Microbacterium sp. SORGH_AS_0969]MDQ1117050.1 hypothetical protein [Microbacterium testaceum]
MSISQHLPPSSAREPADGGVRRPWWNVGVAIAAWFGLWALTPGLLSNGIGHLITDNLAGAIAIETGVALAVVAALLLTHRRFNSVLFARSWSLWLYALPVVLAIALPFHYDLILPVLLYMVWMMVSVFWQDYLTFGLLQSYLGERLPALTAIVLSAAIFWLGHVLFIPERFGLGNWLPSMAILALGVTLASLRVGLKTLHLILALHLSFYFLFA